MSIDPDLEPEGVDLNGIAPGFIALSSSSLLTAEVSIVIVGLFKEQ